MRAIHAFRLSVFVAGSVIASFSVVEARSVHEVQVLDPLQASLDSPPLVKLLQEGKEHKVPKWQRVKTADGDGPFLCKGIQSRSPDHIYGSDTKDGPLRCFFVDGLKLVSVKLGNSDFFPAPSGTHIGNRIIAPVWNSPADTARFEHEDLGPVCVVDGAVARQVTLEGEPLTLNPDAELSGMGGSYALLKDGHKQRCFRLDGSRLIELPAPEGPEIPGVGSAFTGAHGEVYFDAASHGVWKYEKDSPVKVLNASEENRVRLKECNGPYFLAEQNGVNTLYFVEGSTARPVEFPKGWSLLESFRRFSLISMHGEVWLRMTTDAESKPHTFGRLVKGTAQQIEAFEESGEQEYGGVFDLGSAAMVEEGGLGDTVWYYVAQRMTKLEIPKLFMYGYAVGGGRGQVNLVMLISPPNDRELRTCSPKGELLPFEGDTEGLKPFSLSGRSFQTHDGLSWLMVDADSRFHLVKVVTED